MKQVYVRFHFNIKKAFADDTETYLGCEIASHIALSVLIGQ